MTHSSVPRTRRVLAATALAVALALVGPISAPAGAATVQGNATTYAGAWRGWNRL